MMLKATIAEILHAKDPLRFGRLIGYFLEAGLITARSLRRRERPLTRRGVCETIKAGRRGSPRHTSGNRALQLVMPVRLRSSS